MQTLGIIIARAGSLGLKNKHLLPLLGRPLFHIPSIMPASASGSIAWSSPAIARTF
jgi:CMP-N-acetylneuraminic acid synthetase